MSLASSMMCRAFARSDAKRDEGLTIPEGVAYIRDIPYGPDPVFHTLDIAYPEGRKGSLPTIVSIHGGGYVYGSARLYSFYCADLAARGYTVVNFNYRLAPKHKFPAPLQDTNAVLEWLTVHREKYPIDMENVILVGDSAGAQLASQYGVICTSPEYAEIMGIRPPEFRLAGLGLSCGMYDPEVTARSTGAAGSIMRDYFTKDPERFGEKLRPLKYITDRYPPAYLLSSGGDFLLENCAPMAEFLTGKGVECAYKIYGDKSVGHVFHLNIRSPLAREATDEQLAYLRQYLR